MAEIAILKLVHVLALVYWLGADLGVFYSSFFVTNPELSAETRVATSRIMFALDQAPRICMTLMLPTGLHLGWRFGLLPLSATTVAVIWIVCLLWLAVVITLYVASDGPGKSRLTRIDYGFRATLASALLLVGVLGIVTTTLTMPHWFAWKVIIFGGLVACGLMVRIRMRNFGPAFATLRRGDPAASDNETIAASLAAARPFVIAIWAGVLASAALGLHVI